ncbi:MAG TPA: hypothetical protein VGS23_08945, partial [Thermoplasmata archaeon]|nr:hypothetical protein [Thermoplasmata archaeon]
SLREARSQAAARRETALAAAHQEAEREAKALLESARLEAGLIDQGPSLLDRVPTERILKAALEGLSDDDEE